MNEVKAEYDSPWKQALESFLPLFFQLCLPVLYALIDWSQGYRVLEQELEELNPNSDTERIFADKLFEVCLFDGNILWILIHIEVQSQQQPNFPLRMYQYNYRAFDRYGQPVVSIAILGDEVISWRPSRYEYRLDGFSLLLQFPIVKLLDYEQRWEELEASMNPIALMIMAHLKTKGTTNNLQQRKQWKWRLIRLMLERGYTRDEMVILFRLIDRMMALSVELQESFKQDLRQYREEREMPFLSRIEEEILEQGIQQGIQETLRNEVLEILTAKFSQMPANLPENLNTITDNTVLRQILIQAAVANSLSEFEASFPLTNSKN